MSVLDLEASERLHEPAPMAATRPGTSSPRAGGSLPRIVRQGIGGYAAVLAVAVVAVWQLAMPRVWAAGTVAVVASWLAYSFAAQPAYERARSFRPSRRLLAVGGAVTMLALVAGAQSTHSLRQAIAVVIGSAVAFATMIAAHRRLLRDTPTVLVGRADLVERLARRWDPRRDIRLVAMCAWPAPDERSSGRPVAAALEPVVDEVLAAVARHHAASVVIASDRAFTDPALRRLAWELQRGEVECLAVADMNDHVEYVRPRRVGDQLALGLRPPNDHLMSRALKLVLDRLVAAAALLLLAPVLLVLALAVRLTSPGPAFFRQRRAGRDGIPFTMYKLRSMVVDAEQRLDDLRELDEGAGPLFKLSDDPRVTPLGRLLRATSLDELPQLYNVLRGDMSLVGPRPALPSETAAYDEWVWRRLHARPGLTGLWQVSGRSHLTWEESVRMDLQYVNNWNLRLDLAILARTPRAVLRRDGAM